jgi:hypothetical protein
MVIFKVDEYLKLVILPLDVEYLRAVVKVQGKVKCTFIQALRLCTGRTAYRGRG